MVKSKKKPRWGYVYFARSRLIHKSGIYKIKGADNPESRCEGLKIDIIHKIKTNDYHELEGQWHNFLKNFRAHDDWFDLSKAPIEFWDIVVNAAKGDSSASIAHSFIGDKWEIPKVTIVSAPPKGQGRKND